MLVSDPTMVKKKVVFFRNSLGYSTDGNFLENDNKMLMAHPALGDRYTFCVQKMPLFFFLCAPQNCGVFLWSRPCLLYKNTTLTFHL